jgi:hypothetical protein
MLQAYVSCVLNVSEVCCKCVHMDVTYVAIVVQVCCKRLFPMFHLFFRRTLQIYLCACCIYFTHMLLVFYLDVAYGCNGFQAFLGVFASISYACSKCLYVASVASRCFKNKLDVAHGMRVGSGRGRAWTHEMQARAGDVRVARPPLGCAEQGCRLRLQPRASVRTSGCRP